MTSPARARGAAALAASAALALTACTGVAQGEEAQDDDSTDTTGTVFDATTVHDITVEIDDAEYQAMIATYLDSGDKEWISGTVTVDGETFTNVGLRLKGNSSLMGVNEDTAPETLPWRIELDEFVEGQSIDGYTDFVARANNTETALNEAVALDLLEAAGLASEHAVSASFSVNGSEADLRLVLQNLDGDWEEQNFGDEGILYKADAEGDYSYRGDDATAYAEAFDVEAGDEDYTPLVELLDFVNNSADDEFADDLSSYLDVEAFARYLAFEDLISNFDDIAGPGNNSYLRWDADTGVFTVVAWDHNLAFGAMGQAGPGGRDGEMPEGFAPPEDGEMPEGFAPPEDGEMPEDFAPPQDGGEVRQAPGGAGAMGGRSNVLAERFQEIEDFAALYDAALADLHAELIDSGLAQDVLDGWVDMLTEHAADLVDSATIESDAEQIESVLAGETPQQEMPGQPSQDGTTPDEGTTSESP